MLSKIKEMFHTFPYIVTGVLWACAIFISIFNRDGLIPVSLLWQILAVSFLCAGYSYLPAAKNDEAGKRDPPVTALSLYQCDRIRKRKSISLV